MGVELVEGRSVERKQVEGALRARHDSVFRVEWVEIPAGESPQQLAIVGDVLDGVEADRYASLEALGEAIEGGAPAPEPPAAVFPSTTTSCSVTVPAFRRAPPMLKPWKGSWPAVPLSRARPFK